MTKRLRTEFDPITLEILWARIISIVDEASATFSRASFSTLVREANDFAVILTDADGRSIAQSTKSIPSFIGTLPATIKAFLERYPSVSLQDGDVMITNDPWLGTGHVHDINIVVPIFWKGELVGFAGIATHLPDIGGRIRSTGVREIFEEGLQIPPLKLFEAGARNETLIAMIARNVRVPDHSLGDILGAVAGCQALGAELRALLTTEEIDLAALAGMLQSRSEDVMRRAISDVPDGQYNHVVRHDGFEERIVIDCTIDVSGDEMQIDYTGSSEQLPRAVNVVPAYTFAYTAYGVKVLLAPGVPNNEGSFKPIATSAPSGSILNPNYPAASGGRGIIGHMLPAAVMGALAPVLGKQFGAEGSANSSFTMTGEHGGRRYAVVNFLNAGQGATALRDGQTVLSFPSNLGNTPVEVMESLAPIHVLHRSRRRHSGGKGLRRGGDGQSLTFEFYGDEPAVCSFITTRRIVPPAGANGGEDGAAASVKINGQVIDPAEHQILRKGDRIDFLTAGGGGFGEPS
ncbi:MAG: hydantoinase B/oxoprolinase family protein [Hyphomicrobiaceae bacterium]